MTVLKKEHFASISAYLGGYAILLVVRLYSILVAKWNNDFVSLVK